MVQQSSQISLSASTEFQHFGMRLDQVVADLFPDYSRSKLKEWILAGNVCVNGEPCVVPRQKMTGDEVISVEAEIEQQVVNEAQAIELDIVYEDEDILIINKPADLVVHPGAGNQDGTLLNALLAHVPDIDKVPRAGIVHRLDKDTTGLMVVAKTLPAQTHLVDQLQTRVMSREYEALVNGTMVAGGLVDAPIGRHSTKRTHMAVREMGKPAVTHYRVIEKFRAHTHVRLKLETGRTHQIRVHMAYIKHPLVGDPAYGGRLRLPKGSSDEFANTLRGFNRQALHAAQLSLYHPTTDEWMTWQAPLPQDMVALIDSVREDTKIHGIDDY
ncbi:23S rRNA pseudouridine1911/1915/1917 synthase [Marisediminitalea aggregata]|jgi:23S rRNA pseudouridine1911/1915/1917 synthase|uniref:Pseudouridine synthase n=1 Tax=Marisediminitalea aggregata TaxID=634436 RepID=A0A1M5L114_9ALTE|nr:23S rRNA pseudouridine(1911/1915/1917) synthase RluD [Marisediminitalea aggregata]MAP21399.1 23S rRNA pseudouridine(1911/1915/1917) synthase RluD [Alteromonadaceae bacterium]MCP3864612.1 23S rRNA pseudouridine(1911/1915/1917) synthase RluD [Aestuariibacter sp.]MEC7825288.1 23S rRNA pseudouridine(1911/1915/1917) synthase RluD [Pseudomonadota bacterium]BBO26934.1 ribosomal large subunit pseudouridine synthase D [Alteromonas sp. I4]MAX44972.1 23S rRNA pseudouridine(1911/1915/1917) synthase Rlu|tara:strand:- start:8610 stop:9593 length:984 start_codon:yes stop_codon:yes gene_type:complete